MPRFSGVIDSLPFAITKPRFRFQALSAHAGRAPLGGDREIALAIVLVGRLAEGLVLSPQLSAEEVTKRSDAAKHWLGIMAIPQAAKAPLLKGIETLGAPGLADKRKAASALAEVAATFENHLDQASIAELRAVARDLELAQVQGRDERGP